MPRLVLTLALLFGGILVIPCQGQTKRLEPPRPIAVDLPARTEPISFSKDVLGMLESKCVGCHSSALAESRLNMEEVAGMLKGGKRGPAIVRGKADSSLLFTMAAHRVEPIMPPREKPKFPSLTSQELGILKLWIDAGAVDDSADDDATAAKSIELGDLPPGVHPINAVDLTNDGQKVAAGRANLVQVYDVESGLPIISLGGHRDLIQSVRFSPDGTLLAAGSYQIVTVWTVPKGRAGFTLSGHTGRVLAMQTSPDGTLAYSGGEDKTVRVWRLSDGKPQSSFPLPAAVSALALLPGGQGLLAGGADGVVRRLTLSEGREVQVFKAHTGPITNLSVVSNSAQDLRFVSASEDGSVRIWTAPIAVAAKPSEKTSPAPSTSVILAGHKGPIRALATTSHGKMITTAGDDATVRLYNTSEIAKPTVLKTGHSGPIHSLAISPDSQTVLSGSADGTARLTSLTEGKPLLTLSGHKGSIKGVGFSPSGDRLVTAGEDGGLKLWDAHTGNGIIALGHVPPKPGPLQPIFQVAFTGNDSLITASADSTLKTWSMAGSWGLYRIFNQHVFRVLTLDFSPDGKLLATGGGEPSRSGEIKVWELGKALLGSANDTLHSDTVFALKFSPDGTKLASASADKFLKVTRVSDGSLLRSFEGHTHHVLAVDWKSDGKQLVSGGADNVLKLWDYDQGEQLKTLTAAGKQITSLRWIPGKSEIAGACGDAQVRIWSPNSGSILRSLTGPNDYVFSVATSADGKRIAAGGSDGVLFIWIGTGSQPVRKLEPPKVATPVAASSLNATNR
jgi:WD40 repeat protein